MKKIGYILFFLLITSLACVVMQPETRVIEVTQIVDVTQIVPAEEVEDEAESPVEVDSENFSPDVAGCEIFPVDHIWNTRVDNLPVHPNSDAYIRSMGNNETMHADFGSGEWEGEPIGIPFDVVEGNQAKVRVDFEYDDESDAGPYPIPENASIEGGPDSDGDRHILLIDKDNCILYELFYAFPNGDGSWSAGSGAIYDLSGYDLRPDGWTSADAAGLPIFPGLILYDEIVAGEIRHAIRVTAEDTQQAYVWPARHFASSVTDPDVPPMGQYFRLKADFDISSFSHETQIILQAMKTYGLILADNGANWFISGAPDSDWDNDVLHEFHQISGSAFEAVDVSSLMMDADSGQVRP